MQLGLLLRYTGAPGGPDMDLVLEAERLGYSQVWSGEAYGTDAVTPTTWILAQTTKIQAGTGIMQMPARSPACAAMTAMTLQAMSNNRFMMGLGPSGPQVAEGWHGVPFGKPLTKTREYVEITRKIFARDGTVNYDGEEYQLPYKGPRSTGLGKALKSSIRATSEIPIYTASFTPAGLRTAAEIANGVLPIYMSPEKSNLITGPVKEGLAKREEELSLTEFDIAPFVRVAMGNDLQACRDVIRPQIALYVGGMGAREKNFYNDFVKTMGYEEAATKIQDAYLDRRYAEAASLVPDELIDEMCLVGSKDRINDRLQAWKEASKTGAIKTMLVGGVDAAALRVIAEAVL